MAVRARHIGLSRLPPRAYYPHALPRTAPPLWRCSEQHKGQSASSKCPWVITKEDFLGYIHGYILFDLLGYPLFYGAVTLDHVLGGGVGLTARLWAGWQSGRSVQLVPQTGSTPYGYLVLGIACSRAKQSSDWYPQAHFLWTGSSTEVSLMASQVGELAGEFT